MARARILKPQFFANDELGELPPLTRLLFQGLWCLADREGRLEDRPTRIKAQILPYDNADPNDMLEQLNNADFIIRYQVAGQRYIQVVNFLKHQRPHPKELPSVIPAHTQVVTSSNPEHTQDAPRAEQGSEKDRIDPSSNLDPFPSFDLDPSNPSLLPKATGRRRSAGVVSPEVKEAMDYWISAGLGPVSQKAQGRLAKAVAAYGLELVKHGLQRASEQSVSGVMSWLEVVLPAWKREGEQAHAANRRNGRVQAVQGSHGGGQSTVTAEELAKLQARGLA